MAVSFDLFGTLVAVDAPPDPAAAVASELRERGVAAPGDWDAAYREPHVDTPAGAEVPLPAHVDAALRSRGVDAPANAARRAVVAAFDLDVRTREGAAAALAAAGERGPVGLLSNCSVPELVSRTLIRADVPRDAFDAVTTSVACGWRKPDRRAFEALADELSAESGTNVGVGDLVHVGDDPRTDGGVADCGGRFVDAREVPLSTLADRLREGRP